MIPGETEFLIRIATVEDKAVIAKLSRITFLETFAPCNRQENMDLFMQEQFYPELLESEVGAPGHQFLLALKGREPVGYAFLREGKYPGDTENRSAIEIARIYTIQALTGRGVGAALMKRCLQIARENQKETVWLGVWEHNHRAIAFYRKWGFHKFGTHFFRLGNERQTDWLMKKELGIQSN